MERSVSRRFVGAVVVAAVATACATIMGVEEPRRIDELDGSITDNEDDFDGSSPSFEGGEILEDGGCLGEGCPCTSDTECRAPFVKCVASRCVQCVATPTDTCPSGSYCTDENTCAIGCRTNEECNTLTGGVSPFCNLERHQCVACLDGSHCDGGKSCSPSGTCTDTCTGTGAGTCAGANQTCCNGFCVDTNVDALNCGACGFECSTANGQPSCQDRVCSWTCNVGFMHCQPGNTGCETNTAEDLQHCGSCTNDCGPTVLNANGVTCSVSSCTYASCKPGFGNCDGNRANGCECACGKRDQPCCPGNVCTGPDERCGADNKCHPCGKKNAPCSAGNDNCCKGCNTGSNKCK